MGMQIDKVSASGFRASKQKTLRLALETHLEGLKLAYSGYNQRGSWARASTIWDEIYALQEILKIKK